jgi:hypothetical protein
LAERRTHDDGDAVRRFAENEIAPVSEELWEAEAFPYAIWKRAAELGFTGLPYPEQYAGGGGSWLSFVIVLEELARVDCAVANSLMANSSVASLLNAYGTDAQKKAFLTPILDGSRIGAIGLTEPNAGSDAANIGTRAVQDGEHWIITGAKTFISNSGTDITGPVVIAAVTGTKPDGRKEISNFIVPADTPGFTTGRKLTILAALQQRERTGQGCMVESNLLNAALDLQIEPFTYFLNKGPLWQRSSPAMGSRFHPAPYGVYRTQDGWIAISLTTTAKLAAALDCSELAALDHPKDPVRNRDRVHQLVAKSLLSLTTERAIQAFDQQDIWWAPVNDYEQVEADPQVAHNGIVMEVDHPEAGAVRLMAHPVRYDGQAPALRRMPPALGQHTREVLAEAGYSAGEIEQLIAEGVALTGKQEERA